MSLRYRLWLSFAPVLLLLILLGAGFIYSLGVVGDRIEAILRENYRSVEAMNGLNEAVERIDSSFQFAQAERSRAKRQYDENWAAYQKHLKVEQNNITGLPVKYSRQHYIRMVLPQTYRNLLRAGIVKDFSMGYGGANGFRASIASSFYWYDLEEEKQTGLKLYPFCFMDSNAFYEGKLTPQQAFLELMHYYRKIKQLNGLMITVWHNQFFGPDPAFAGWKEAYEVFLRDEIYWDM